MNNLIVLHGFIKNLEIKITPNNVKIASFGLATKDKKKNEQGEWQDDLTWHNVVVFGKLAEALERNFDILLDVGVTGKLIYSSFEDQNGSKHKQAKIIASSIDYRKFKNKEQQNNSSITSNNVDDIGDIF